MHIYMFVSKNTTNIWAGIGARMWAVSDADPAIMPGRETRASRIRIGEVDLIYRSEDQELTTPFMIRSRPDPKGVATGIWPETWFMPFQIQPLGTPKLHWSARDAARTLPFNRASSNRNLASVFKAVGTAVFSPIDVEAQDWEMILEKLSGE